MPGTRSRWGRWEIKRSTQITLSVSRRTPIHGFRNTPKPVSPPTHAHRPQKEKRLEPVATENVTHLAPLHPLVPPGLIQKYQCSSSSPCSSPGFLPLPTASSPSCIPIKLTCPWNTHPPSSYHSKDSGMQSFTSAPHSPQYTSSGDKSKAGSADPTPMNLEAAVAWEGAEIAADRASAGGTPQATDCRAVLRARVVWTALRSR